MIMDKLLTGVLTAPIATVFIISGIIFLFVSVVGSISGKIEPSVKSRIASGILGLIFISTGLMIHLNQEVPKPSRVIMADQNQSESILIAPQAKVSSELQIVGEPENSIPVVTDVEPNDRVTNANPILVGTTTRGTISTRNDRDFYKLEALSNRTRIILRKLSRAGFYARVEIYNDVEKEIDYAYNSADTPVTLSFKSVIGATYYIVIECDGSYNNGDYELVIKKEKNA